MARKTYTSPQVKARWNKKNYDRIAVLIPKGQKDEFSAFVKEKYGLSMNAYINWQIRKLLGVSEEDWRPLYRGEKKNESDDSLSEDI